MNVMLGLESQISTLGQLQPMRISGRVSALRGLTLLVQDLPMPVGSLVAVARGGVRSAVGAAAPERLGDRTDGLGEIVGFDGPSAIVMISAERMKSVRTAPLIFCFSSATTSTFGSASARARSRRSLASAARCERPNLCTSFSKPS